MQPPTDQPRPEEALAEDEYDIVAANEAYEEYLKSGCKSCPISELWKNLGFEKESFCYG